MIDMIRKSLLASLGLVVVTREKVKEAAGQFVAQGKLTKEEVDLLVRELSDEGEKQWQELQETVDGMVQSCLENLDIGSRSEFIEVKEQLDNIGKRLTIFEERLSSLEKRGGASLEQ